MAKKDIILSGVGGQGILSIATVIGWAALDQNLHLKQAEVHGMSQRGGDVQSNLRISTERIWSDLIPKGECDLILSLEPMEDLSYPVSYAHIRAHETPEPHVCRLLPAKKKPQQQNPHDTRTQERRQV